MTDQDKTQFDNMVSAWTGYQRQLWDCWGSVAKVNDPNAPLEEACKRPLEAWRELSKECLQIVSESVHTAKDTFNPGDNIPPLVSRSFEQMRSMLDQWSDVQQKMLNAWLKAVKELNPSTYTFAADPFSSWNENANSLFQTWKEANEKTLETQTNLLASAIPWQAKDSKPEARPGKVKPTPHKKAAA